MFCRRGPTSAEIADIGEKPGPHSAEITSIRPNPVEVGTNSARLPPNQQRSARFALGLTNVGENGPEIGKMDQSWTEFGQRWADFAEIRPDNLPNIGQIWHELDQVGAISSHPAHRSNQTPNLDEAMPDPACLRMCAKQALAHAPACKRTPTARVGRTRPPSELAGQRACAPCARPMRALAISSLGRRARAHHPRAMRARARPPTRPPAARRALTCAAPHAARARTRAARPCAAPHATRALTHMPARADRARAARARPEARARARHPRARNRRAPSAARARPRPHTPDQALGSLGQTKPSNTGGAGTRKTLQQRS